MFNYFSHLVAYLCTLHKIWFTKVEVSLCLSCVLLVEYIILIFIFSCRRKRHLTFFNSLCLFQDDGRFNTNYLWNTVQSIFIGSNSIFSLSKWNKPKNEIFNFLSPKIHTLKLCLIFVFPMHPCLLSNLK